jgi:hypothetical protein
MSEKNLFPDYEPKITQDTIEDYLRGASKVYDILAEVGEPSSGNLKRIVKYLKKYVKKAIKNPGGTRKGSIAIGADFNQYYPSEEELIASELGKMIEKIVNSHSREEFEKVKVQEGIKSQKIEFNEIYFRHVDIMGSGRFFYAEKRLEKKEVII